MKKYLLLSVFCILLCTDRGKSDKAQKLLNTLDLDEIVEKLEEFDVDQDGQLSEMEVELQQPGIQKYLDRYEELLKAEEDEKDDEEDADKKKDPKPNQKTVENEKTEKQQKTDAQQTTQRQESTVQGDKTKQQKDTVTPSAASANQQNKQEDQKQQTVNSAEPRAVEDEDDGVEIEVVEDLEFVNDNETQNYSNVALSAIALAVLLGIPTVLYIVCSKARADWHAKQRQKEEKMIQQREAWLNRMASSQPKKEPENNKRASQSSPPASSSGSKMKDTPPVTPLTDNLATKLTISPKPGPDQCKSGSNANAGKKLSDMSNTDSKDVGEPSPKVARTTKPLPGVPKTTAGGKESRGGKTNGPLSGSAGPEPAPVPAEKTSDVEKLKGFLEKAFKCELTLTDDIPKMRFSGGRMRVPTGDFPTCLEDVESKMKKLVHQAFDKQVNKVKFSIHAYNVCDSSGSAFHDSLVDSTIAIIQTEAVDTVLSSFQGDSESKSNKDSSGPGLWDDGNEEDVLSYFQFETFSFLPRLTGRSQDGENVSPSMLSALLSHEKSYCLVSALLHVGGSRVILTERLDEMMLTEVTTLQGLDLLMNDANIADRLAKILRMETEKAVRYSLGNFFQENCALSELLKISTIPHSISSGPQSFQPPHSAAEPFRSLRTFPKLSQDDVDTAQMMIMKGLKQVRQLVYYTMRRVFSYKATREVGLSWLATLISLNELRTSSVPQDNMQAHPVCSDGFMLNVCAMLLEFFLPISQSMEKLEKVDMGYSVSPACRLIYNFETCLADGQIVPSKEQAPKLGGLPAALQGQHSFITECFHLTQRALSITVVPAIKHFDRMHSYYNNKLEKVKDTDKAKEEEINDQHLLVSVVWETCLLDTDLVIGITTFYISQAKLLLRMVHSLAEKHKNVEEAEAAQRKALSVVPEFCVKDMAQWFSFLANTVLRVKPNATKGITLTPFVDCCVMLLERPDLMPGPVPASMIVTALLTFMKDSDQSHKLGIRNSWGSGVMSDLAAMVHTCPSAQTKLGPALLRTYVSVDVVEGLDVDKDTFDKFNTRVQIGQLVQKLWSRSDCRGSIIDQCGTEMFQSFLNSILDTLLYMLHDSLSRLANVKKIETLKANEAEWNALSQMQQNQKESFLRSEEKVGSGFMRQAKNTLKFLNLLSQSERVAQCFTHQPLAARAASTINGFLDSLCGAKAKNLKVKDMAKYDFNPVELLLDIMNVILRITMEDVSHTDGYLVSMVKDPDFELANLEKAESVIVGKGYVSEDTTGKVAQLMEQVRRLAAEHCPAMPLLGEDEGSWRDAFVDLDIDEQSLEKEYVSVMEAQRFSCARILQSHCFQNNVQGACDPRSPKLKVLMKEMKQLSTSLPVNARASIFVRQDKDRMDVMRALVTGPSGTPYSLGCFCFDVYFPAAYPNVPPLVKIITTGSGTVRFNPNLYADGKVCLSLLGTWHAGDASEKWNPSKSSLYQVLVSIQSMILTSDPVFNEPGYERIKGTEEGEVQSRQYNWKIHLQTLRHAVLGQLRNPHPGFEHVIRRHFALQREAVFKQCAEWVQGCEDPDTLKRLRKVADSIFEEFMKLEVDFNEAEEDSEEDEEEDN